MSSRVRWPGLTRVGGPGWATVHLSKKGSGRQDRPGRVPAVGMPLLTAAHPALCSKKVGMPVDMGPST
jgi:hypothetical protein